MRELFFLISNIIFSKLCFEGYFIGYYSSQAIKLDSESLCTLSRFDFSTDA